jgi:hypothetical protein
VGIGVALATKSGSRHIIYNHQDDVGLFFTHF